MLSRALAVALSPTTLLFTAFSSHWSNRRPQPCARLLCAACTVVSSTSCTYHLCCLRASKLSSSQLLAHRLFYTQRQISLLTDCYIRAPDNGSEIRHTLCLCRRPAGACKRYASYYLTSNICRDWVAPNTIKCEIVLHNCAALDRVSTCLARKQRGTLAYPDLAS
jgi:hypothetical protein